MDATGGRCLSIQSLQTLEPAARETHPRVQKYDDQSADSVHKQVFMREEIRHGAEYRLGIQFAIALNLPLDRAPYTLRCIAGS